MKKGVVNVCFSHDGKRIAASSLDEDHTIAVYDIEAAISARENPKPAAKGKEVVSAGLIAIGKGTKAEILDLRFAPDN